MSARSPSGALAPPRISSRQTGSGDESAASSRSASPTSTASKGASLIRNSSNGSSKAATSGAKKEQPKSEPFSPASDAQTYRDLLIFEERLKQNAARLIKRKKKYQIFLVLLCAGIAISAYYVFIRPAKWQPLHYLNVSDLLISSTMLLLFFASGLYSERITAANKFVPQANRSLRSYNMYLNTRTAPRRSFFGFFKASPTSPTGPRSPQYLPGEKDAPSGTGTRLVRVPSANGGPGVTRRTAIPAIPPTTNPRGELIFSSKVSPQFREGYERYRAAFERRRQEKLEERRMQGWRSWRIFRWRRRAGSSGDPERGAHLEKARADTATRPENVDGERNSSVRDSPRAKKAKVRRAAGTSGMASESSSLHSTPTSSPKTASRAQLSASPRSSAELVREAVSEPEGKSAQIEVDGEGARPLRRSPRNSVSSRSEEQPAADTTSSTDSVDAATSSPDPETVASRADDRHDPEATLREPQGN